jgi:hypothetical protein
MYILAVESGRSGGIRHREKNVLFYFGIDNEHQKSSKREIY